MWWVKIATYFSSVIFDINPDNLIYTQRYDHLTLLTKHLQLNLLYFKYKGEENLEFMYPVL